MTPSDPRRRIAVSVAVELRDRLLNLGDGGGADAVPLVQHPVHDGAAETGLDGDVAHPVAGRGALAVGPPVVSMRRS